MSRWIAVSGAEKSLTAYAYGPFPSMEAAMVWLNQRPDGYATNIYELRAP